jgi:hypothetical protein
MRAVQLPPIPVVHHRNNASNPARTSATVVNVTSNAVCANFLSCRHSGELALDEFEIVGDRVQVAAGLIDLAQRERAFVWHAHVLPESSYAAVKDQLEC